MKSRSIMLFVLALICGSSAAVGVNQLRQTKKDTGPATVSVVVAAKDLSRGELLTDNVVELRPWPEALVPKGAMRSIEGVQERSVLVPLVAGEVIYDSKLAAKGAGRGLAAMISPGMRAFTILSPDVAAGVGGFILPSNRVDVLLTTTSTVTNDPTGGAATTTLLQNVEVLAVDEHLNAPDGRRVGSKKVTSVTLLVTPDQAAKLDLGMNRGILHLALRNPEDSAEAKTRPALMSELQFHQEKPVDKEQISKSFWEGISETVERSTAAFAKATSQFQGAARPSEDELSKSEQTEAETKSEAPDASQFLQIRTLRGTHSGSIRVEIE